MASTIARAHALAIDQSELSEPVKRGLIGVLVSRRTTGRLKFLQGRFDYERKLSILRKTIGSLIQISSPQASVWLCVSPRFFHKKTPTIKRDRTIYVGKIVPFDYFVRTKLEEWWAKHMPKTWAARFKPIAGDSVPAQHIHPLLPRCRFLEDLHDPNSLWLTDKDANVLGHALLNDLPDAVIIRAAKERGLMFASILDVVQKPWAEPDARRMWMNACSAVLLRTNAHLQTQAMTQAIGRASRSENRKRL